MGLLLGPCSAGTAATPGLLPLKGASRKWAGIAPRASIIVLPSDERVERSDAGREGSAIAAEARSEPGECMVGDGCCHVSAGKRELLGDGKRIGSPLAAAVGMAEVPAGNRLGNDASGA
jgi:hypothetical protein